MSADARGRTYRAFRFRLWQIHAFREGNTRTTAVFRILYLRSIGLMVDNSRFARHSWVGVLLRRLGKYYFKSRGSTTSEAGGVQLPGGRVDNFHAQAAKQLPDRAMAPISQSVCALRHVRQPVSTGR